MIKCNVPPPTTSHHPILTFPTHLSFHTLSLFFYPSSPLRLNLTGTPIGQPSGHFSTPFLHSLSIHSWALPSTSLWGSLPRLKNKLGSVSSFPWGSDSKESTYNTGDLGSIPGLGRSPGEGNGYLLQCSSLENSMEEEPEWLTFLLLSPTLCVPNLPY